MFEYDQDIVEVLLSDSERFQALYNEHNTLKEKVRDAELGVLPLDAASLGTMKKEKLLAKDKMAVMIEQYRRETRLTRRAAPRRRRRAYERPAVRPRQTGFSPSAQRRQGSRQPIQIGSAGECGVSPPSRRCGGMFTGAW